MSKLNLTSMPEPKSNDSRTIVEPKSNESRKTSEAQRRAVKTYSDKQSQIAIRISPDMKKQWDEHSNRMGESLRGFIIRSVNNQIASDSKKVDLDKLLKE